MPTQILACVEIDPPSPPSYVVIWLHGLGADGHDFEAIVPELRLPESRPMRFVFPHAPVRPVTINYGMEMRAWYDILEMDVARKVDVKGIELSSSQIERLIQRELDNGFAAEQILLAGFSQGGAIALHTGLRYGQRLAGIIGLSTYLPTLDGLKSQRSKVNADIEIFMAHGRQDPVIPMTNAIATREELLRLGYSVQWHDYPMQHEVCMQEIDQLRTWILACCL